MSHDFTVEETAVRTNLDGVAPGFVVCDADGVASLVVIGSASAFVVDTVTRSIKVRS